MASSPLFCHTYQKDTQLPKHVGLIMDGNVRWAEKHALSQKEGHRRGMQTMIKIIEEARQLGIPYLTFYCFSIENQARPQPEIDHIMSLALEFVAQNTPFFTDAGIRFQMVGDREGLRPNVRQTVEELEEKTQNLKGLHLTCAVNYGGRQEIVKAITNILSQQHGRAMAAEAPQEAEVEELLKQQLETGKLPELDLIIRTSGEQRLSNFLLWQAAYSEFVFTQVLWPDFTPSMFKDILHEFSLRERRFGARHHSPNSARSKSEGESHLWGLNSLSLGG